MKTLYKYGEAMCQARRGGRSSMRASRQSCPWESSLQRGDGLTSSQVGGASRPDIPSAQQPGAEDRHTEGTGVVYPVDLPSGSLENPYWHPVGTETRVGTKGMSGIGQKEVCRGNTNSPSWPQREKQGAIEGLQPHGWWPPGMIGRETLREVQLPKLWCGCSS